MEDRKMKNDIWKAVGAYLLIVALVCLGQCFSSCSPRIVPPASVETKTDTIIKERVVRDTVIYEIPHIKETVTTKDTVSVLKNDYACSRASVSDGLLSHSLETIPQKIPVPVALIARDTSVMKAQISTVEKIVEKPLTGWQVFRMRAFDTIAVALLIIALIYVWKKYLHNRILWKA